MSRKFFQTLAVAGVSMTIVIMAGCGITALNTITPTITPTIERLDPALDAIVPDHPFLQRLATGYTWTEGPVWIPAGYLLFADIPSNSIRKWDAGEAAPASLCSSAAARTA